MKRALIQYTVCLSSKGHFNVKVDVYIHVKVGFIYWFPTFTDIYSLIMLAIGTEDERDTERKAFTTINNLKIRKTKYQEGDYLEDCIAD